MLGVAAGVDDQRHGEELVGAGVLAGLGNDLEDIGLGEVTSSVMVVQDTAV